MYFKCNYCDPAVKRGETPIRTINTEKHAYIKDEKKKYYHLDCYKIHLQKRKKLSDQEITEKIEERLEAQAAEMQELEEKNAFLDWIMNFYDGSLPTYFLKKLSSVRVGTYEGLREPIDYITLLDIYQHMSNYLNKIAMQKKFKSISMNMNYDLAVVVGNYGDYKRHKARQQANVVARADINKQTNIDRKVKEASKIIKKEEFDITDYMDELIL